MLCHIFYLFLNWFSDFLVFVTSGVFALELVTKFALI